MRTISTIPVFYTEQMLADAHHYSPSALKPKAVVESWKGLGVPMEIISPDPICVADYYLAHAPDYVNGVLDGRILNGFGNRKPKVNASLAYTNGAMMAAAREAVRNGLVAVAPCSGFHHAGYAYGGDYCTFNGLMIAARKLIQEGLVTKVGILDFDMHYGDGTDDIIKHFQLRSSVKHYSAAMDWEYPEQANSFINTIEGIMNSMTDCDLILYQAGADPHCDDPLGGFLTTPQLLERDRRVFSFAKKFQLPIAWNLAGGYQRDASGGIRPVLDIHDNTLLACWNAA
jgi:acetoin utilization deacetylase AcuC-like enzyme